MIPYAIAIGDIGPEDLAMLECIRAAVELIPDIPGEYITCHTVVRLVAPLARGFVVVDGRFHHSDHSWLQRRGAIIDPYPVGGHTPTIVSTGGFSPWAGLYRPAELSEDVIERFRRQLRLIRIGLRTP